MPCFSIKNYGGNGFHGNSMLDLEGVLVPEIWIGVAEKTGILGPSGNYPGYT